mgnify:CR=1 FL=1
MSTTSLRISSLTNAQWEFVVFESKEANAFCLPGGKVGVYTGILPITKDEAGLATVIGHEVAHATARHGAERLSNQMLLQTGGKAVGAAVQFRVRQPAFRARTGDVDVHERLHVGIAGCRVGDHEAAVGPPGAPGGALPTASPVSGR